MTIQIYAIPVSLYCAKLRILLRHKKLEWREELPPGGYGSSAYKEIVPTGNLPAMVDGDLRLADSEAIAEYLEEAYPEPPALPLLAADRAKVRERSRFHDTRLEPALRALFPTIARDKRDRALAARQSQEISTRLTQLAVLLEGALPERLTLGDCGYPISFAWLDLLSSPLGLEIEWPDRVNEYRSTVEAFPAVARELADYRPKLQDWLAAK